MEVINNQCINENKSSSTDISSGNTSDSSNERKRRTKKEIYQTERNEIINNLNKILGLNDKNSLFYYELENNNELKEYLKNNIENIRKYFKTGTWGYFSNEPLKGMGNEINLVRALYNDCDYNILSKRKTGKVNNEKKLVTELYFTKDLFKK
jgi:hypothetical protein